MATQQANHQQGAVMALNGWSIEDIQTFSLKLNIPHNVTEQMIDGYIATQSGVMDFNAFSMDEIQTFQH